MQSKTLGVLRNTTREANRSGGLLQVHPVPADSDEVLSIAVHLVGHFAAVQGKAVPALSEDAARYLARQRWALHDLAFKVARAVANNQGSLITAADLA